jgi:hypothetical protein
VLSSSGGTLASADGRLTIAVPVGALSGAQTINIQMTSNESPGGAGLGYRLLPAGQTFAAPVTLTFRYDPSEISGSEAQSLLIAFQDSAGHWTPLSNLRIDEAAGTVSGEMLHFTDVALITGYVLRPAWTVLGVGRSFGLKIDLCFPDAYDTVEFIGCRLNEIGDFKWAVEGIANGSAQVGTIDPSTLIARYQAPNAVPAINPVTVSAAVTNRFVNKGEKTLLLAKVMITDHASLAGTIISTQVGQLGTGTMTHTTYASVKLRYDASEGGHRPVSGNVVSRFDFLDPVAGCEYHVAFAGAIGPRDGYLSLREDDGATPRYGADGMTMAAHTGTTNCTSNKATEPLTIDPAGAKWWPAPPVPNALIAIPGAMDLRTAENGSIEALLDWTPGTGGIRTRVQWKLTPVPD